MPPGASFMGPKRGPTVSDRSESKVARLGLPLRHSNQAPKATTASTATANVSSVHAARGARRARTQRAAPATAMSTGTRKRVGAGVAVRDERADDPELRHDEGRHEHRERRHRRRERGDPAGGGIA